MIRSFVTRYYAAILLTLLLIFTVGLLAYGAVAAYRFFQAQTSFSPTPEAEALEAMRNVNETFLGLKDEIEAGDVAGIKAELEAKIAAAENPVERGMLVLTLAQLIVTEDLSAGIANYKQIATDGALPPSMRVSAFMALATLHYTDVTDDTTLAALIFTDEAPFGDMKPKDQSSEEIEAAYARLLTYADDLQQTTIVNAQLAAYYAERSFLDQENPDLLNSALMRVTISESLISKTPKNNYDASLPAAKVTLGTAKLYLLGPTLTDPRDALTLITDGLSEFRSVSKTLIDEAAGFQGSNTRAKDTTRGGFDRTEHELWEGLLEAAATLATVRPDVTKSIVNLYVAHITSPIGTAEKMYAQDPRSDIAPFITVLQTHSESLTEALK